VTARAIVNNAKYAMHSTLTIHARVIVVVMDAAAQIP
jgi:hypothetical protein